MVVTIPFVDSFGLSPMFIIIEQPVPSVAFAAPGETQPSPNAAACESPIIAEIFKGLGKRPLKSDSPKNADEGFTIGRFNFDNPKVCNSSLSQSRVLRLKNKVRDAFV